MYKLNLGLAYSILKLKYLPHNKYTHILDKIQQHRIILNERIIGYYLESTPEEYVEVIQTYLDSLIYADSTHIYMNSIECSSVEEEIVSLVEKNPMKVLIADENDFDKRIVKRIKLITPEDIRTNKVNSFYRYTIPISNHIAIRGEPCDAYAKWFGHLMEGEEKIYIIDKCIMKSNGVASLKQYYLPYIEKNTKVSIYCMELDGALEKDIIDEIGKPEYSDWNIEVNMCRKFHERYIAFGDIQISIGVGLDFLHPRGKVRENCNISISRYNPSIMPQVLKTVTN